MRRFIVICMILMILLSTSVLALKPNEGSITATVPENGQTYVSGIAYSVAPNSLVTLENMNNGATKNIVADKYGRFTAAIPAQTGDEIQASFLGSCKKVEVIGDLRKPRKIADAIREGFEKAYLL